MNRRPFHPAVAFFLLTLAVALFSWIGSMYGWHGVQNLLNAEGVRRLLRNAVPDVLSAPLFGHLLILAPGVGLCLHSGWWAFSRRMFCGGGGRSRKEMRAWKSSVVAGAAWIIVCAGAAWGPWDELRGITGNLQGSPLADGASCLCSLGLGAMGVIYGCMADRYRTVRDIVTGMACAFSRFSGFFVTLFFVVQFFTSFAYTGLYQCVGLSAEVCAWLYRLSVILALFVR